MLDIVDHKLEVPSSKRPEEVQSAGQTEAHAQQVVAASDVLQSSEALKTNGQSATVVRVNYSKHETDLPTSERKRPNEPRGSTNNQIVSEVPSSIEHDQFKEIELI